MRNRFAVGAFVVAALVVTSGMAGEALKSGLQVGESPSPFHPTNLTGKFADKKQCLVWIYGGNPVAMIFAREASDSLTSLVKKIDAATVKNKDKKMCSFVVFLTDEEGAADKLKKLAEKEGIKKTIFALDNVAGPKEAKIAKDADVTVVLYNKRNVESNFAFRKGQLNAAAVEKVIGDLKKILE